MPAPNTKVISITFSFSLKTLPKYAGKRNEMQQGAKRATTPATKAAISEVWKSNASIYAPQPPPELLSPGISCIEARTCCEPWAEEYFEDNARLASMFPHCLPSLLKYAASST